jgi:hypothetical protein
MAFFLFSAARNLPQFAVHRLDRAQTPSVAG